MNCSWWKILKKNSNHNWNEGTSQKVMSFSLYAYYNHFGSIDERTDRTALKSIRTVWPNKWNWDSPFDWVISKLHMITFDNCVYFVKLTCLLNGDSLGYIGVLFARGYQRCNNWFHFDTRFANKLRLKCDRKCELCVELLEFIWCASSRLIEQIMNSSLIH